ncbi:CSC1-like protein RXW8 isoform X2 [Cornus florida]|uniref:CSC1-like protein RXW8 isoform X2 n=1 Tax=Cornus florida TaxID=4283 RepID=UPI00289AC03F|nr:CSC1-like protein RXW8 isoform X2 [Cornus florida]
MYLSALLTSAGINIAISVVLLSLYSILRKQPSNVNVYFGQRLAQERSKDHGHFSFDRFVPSPSWMVKAWETSEQELLASGGLDAVVFLRMIVFSIRIFSIAAFICIFLVLPLNYFGKEMQHKLIPSESLEVFTIGNVKEGSKWVWAHCLALYIISGSACVLLYSEYKSITIMRMAYITGSPLSPSHFTVLVRGIPWSLEESYSDSVKKFFSNYHASGYLSHQVVYHSGTVHKLMECAAALVFFRTRYAALVASEILQSPNPMLWVTQLAPEPPDIYWKNLHIPYRQLWIRRIATLLAAIVFMFFFLLPVTFTQGLLHVEQLQKRFPFMRGILEKKFVIQVVTGYLPSVILMIFLYTVPPIMYLLSTVEGPVSRSDRKKSACCKVLYFIIWNVFFVNVFSGTVMNNLLLISKPRDLPTQLAIAVPLQGALFMTYVMTSGWASLSSELMQPVGLLCTFFNRVILRNKEFSYGPLSFPYHTEIPRVLLFGLIGFTCSILVPLVLPLLLVYYFLAYLVYRNQILNVYIAKYESGGQLWPVMHNTTIFSLVLTQIIVSGVFGMKHSAVALGFTVPLIIITLLFNEYCRKRFRPVFENNAAQVLMEMDRQDEQSGRMEEIHKQLRSAYCQFASLSQEGQDSRKDDMQLNHCGDGDGDGLKDPEAINLGSIGEQSRETFHLESGR